MPELHISDARERETLSAFVAHAVRLDKQAVVRLVTRASTGLDAWVITPFGALATRAVVGEISPADITVAGNELLAALTVTGGDIMDPGPARDLLWQSDLPARGDWRLLDVIPIARIAELADQGITLANESVGPLGTPPASLLDQQVLAVSRDNIEVKIQLRCLFALAGMGFYDPALSTDVLRVSVTDSWLRLDARYGAVARRRRPMLSLLT